MEPTLDEIQENGKTIIKAVGKGKGRERKLEKIR